MSSEKNSRLGLIAVGAVWLTGGIGFPLVGFLKMFSVGQLLVARGIALMALPLALRPWGKIKPVIWRYLPAGFWLALCAFTVFQGFRSWGTSLTVVITTTCPVVNFALAYYRKRKIEAYPLKCLLVVIAGVTLAIRPWENHFVVAGLIWSVIGAIAGALFADRADQAREAGENDHIPKCFPLGLTMALSGILASSSDNWDSVLGNPDHIAMLAGFGILLGFLNIWANVVSIANLEPETQTSLVQGETVAAIFFAGIILKEPTPLITWVGALFALTGVIFYSQWVSQQGKLRAKS